MSTFGALVGSLATSPGLTLPCEECTDRTAMFAVGHFDHWLVCEPCLDWGDKRRWWNALPVQRI
ncbi:Uncharacterised protein [Mycobacteroides abscessus subsp. massiliense]|nr:Uncharacterised protein [Mycobacteroides abscessus subsp. abscessus]SKM66270.1 Uncharacterised protein [Mycobacteroides abscessus subsp. massiliense]SKN32934.1 Uncharacterised protein [Mycobacteroides abscessus subsp. massiliense]SKP14786.1 Uncharacterised protein [Mycobacteroides abscessus subsp. massiliense]SKP59073.1 Uncharacterised protein [Mycobacteroides abscessus subsp. massiliense]